MQVKHYTRALAMVLSVSTALAGCVSSGGGSGGDSDSSSSVPRVRGNVITEANLANHQNMSALAALRQLKPQWLRARGFDGVPRLVVDGGVRSSLQDLDNIQASDIATITLLNSGDATQAYGTGFRNGALVVVTR